MDSTHTHTPVTLSLTAAVTCGVPTRHFTTTGSGHRTLNTRHFTISHFSTHFTTTIRLSLTKTKRLHVIMSLIVVSFKTYVHVHKLHTHTPSMHTPQARLTTFLELQNKYQVSAKMRWHLRYYVIYIYYTYNHRRSQTSNSSCANMYITPVWLLGNPLK